MEHVVVKQHDEHIHRLYVHCWSMNWSDIKGWTKTSVSLAAPRRWLHAAILFFWVRNISSSKECCHVSSQLLWSSSSFGDSAHTAKGCCSLTFTERNKKIWNTFSVPNCFFSRKKTIPFWISPIKAFNDLNMKCFHQTPTFHKFAL